MQGDFCHIFCLASRDQGQSTWGGPAPTVKSDLEVGNVLEAPNRSRTGSEDFTVHGPRTGIRIIPRGI